MNIFASFSYRLRRRMNLFFTLLARKWKGRFYLVLAGLFTVLVIADTTYLHLTAEMKQVGLDAMVRYRFKVPKPDKDIVIVDIDETSLAEMSKEFGRWPWPRKVLAELVEQIEKQSPQAIVFDIIYSEPDVFNAESDAYFDSVIAKTNNTFFPMLRLSPYDDAQSQLNPVMIPGVIPMGEGVQIDATIAMLMPYFKSVQDGGRLGLNNIDIDSDGVTRHYQAYMEEYGWKIPSLPLRIAEDLNFPKTEEQRVFLNWRGPPFTYQSVGFSKLYHDMKSKDRKRPADEFTGKIVIIGSTASSLFAIKPTPMSRAHPGVEILATAIDNFKHGDYLRFPEKRYTYMVLTLLVIWLTAWGFYRDTGRDKIDRMFGLSQFLLIGISYVSINLSTTYINLTGPVALGMAFFTIARLYAFATGSMLERSTLRYTLQHSKDKLGVLLLVRLGGQTGALNAGVREKIRLEILGIGHPDKSVDILKGPQKGLWNLFENMFVISWVCSADDTEERQRIQEDIRVIQQSLLPLLQKHYVVSAQEVSWSISEAHVGCGEGTFEKWSTMFGTGLSKLEGTSLVVD